MKYDIIIAGVGGQGILSIAAVLGRAALQQGLRIKQSEVHGMAQRGGAVQSHLRISDETIHSDVIGGGTADMVLSMEPMESLRYLHHLSSEGWVVTNCEPIQNIDNYPHESTLLDTIKNRENTLILDGVSIAREAGMPRALNMAMLGAASAFIPLDASALEEAIAWQFDRKGEAVVQSNVAVFRAAREKVLAEAV